MTDESPLGPEVVTGEPVAGMPGRKELIAAGRAALAELGVAAEDLEAPLPPGGTTDALRWAYGFLVRYCEATGRNRHRPSVGTIRKLIRDAYFMTDAHGRGRGRYGQPYAPNTVATAVYCLSMIFDRVQDQLDMPNPCRHPRVAAELKRYREDYEAAGHRTDEADGLSHVQSVQLARVQDLGTVQGLRNAAMLRGQFDLGCAADEWCRVQGEDLAWLDENHVLVTFCRVEDRRSRSIGMQFVAGPDDDMDPVRLLARYVKARLSAGWDGNGPLWVQVRRGDRPKDYETTGVLGGRFLTEPMHYSAYADVFARLLRKTRIDRDPESGKRIRHFTTYSNRIGMIEAAVRAGLRAEDITPRTGHAPGSRVVWDLLRDVPPWGDANAGVAIRRAAAGEGGGES